MAASGARSLDSLRITLAVAGDDSSWTEPAYWSGDAAADGHEVTPSMSQITSELEAFGPSSRLTAAVTASTLASDSALSYR